LRKIRPAAADEAMRQWAQLVCFAALSRWCDIWGHRVVTVDSSILFEMLSLLLFVPAGRLEVGHCVLLPVFFEAKNTREDVV
jgi:hypothetical protein